MYLISKNVEKHFVVASWSSGRTPLINPLKSYIVDFVAYVDLLEMYLISKNIGKRFFVASWSSGRTLLITPSKSYVVDVVALSNCRMLVEVFFFFPWMLCTFPIYSCKGWTRLLVIGQRMSYWHLAHYDSFLHLTRTTTSFGHVASPCLSWMPSHCDTWHEFGIQGEMDLGFEFNKMDLLICKAQINYFTQWIWF